MNEDFLLYSIDAEMTALGSMLFGEKYLKLVRGVLETDDFFLPSHREIFDSISSVYSKGIAVDPVTLRSELITRGKLDDVGGDAYIMRLQANLPSPANAEHYALIVADYSTLRRLDLASIEISTIVRSTEMDMNDKINRSNQLITAVNATRANPSVTPDELDLTKRQYHLKTGISAIDKLTPGMRGFIGGRPVIVAARSGIGKSTFAMTIARSVFLNRRDDGESVLWYTMGEMDSEEIAKLMIQQGTGIGDYPSESYQKERGIWQDERDFLFGDKFANGQFRIIDGMKMGTHIDRVIANIETVLIKHRTPLVVIDYIGMIDNDNYSERMGLAGIARKLTRLANRYKDTIFLVISQVAGAGDLKPGEATEIFGSGELRRNCGMLLVLKFDKNSDDGIIEAEKVSKGKSWRAMPFYFDKNNMRLVDKEHSTVILTREDGQTNG